ncbi:MAG: hypothetical protein AAB376_00440, partial [Pseudomonadota bacterium]
RICSYNSPSKLMVIKSQASTAVALISSCQRPVKQIKAVQLHRLSDKSTGLKEENYLNKLKIS